MAGKKNKKGPGKLGNLPVKGIAGHRAGQVPGKMGNLPIKGIAGHRAGPYAPTTGFGPGLHKQPPAGAPPFAFAGAGPSMADAGAPGGDTIEPWNIPKGHKGYGMTGPPKLIHPVAPPGPYGTMPPGGPRPIPNPGLGVGNRQDKHGRGPNDPNYMRGTYERGTFPGGGGGGGGQAVGRTRPRQPYTGNPNWDYMQALRHAGIDTETGDANQGQAIFNGGGNQRRMKNFLRRGLINREQFQDYKQGPLADWRDTFGKPGTFDRYMKNVNMDNPYGSGVSEDLLRAGWQSGLRGKDMRGLIGGPTGNEASHMLENPAYAQYFMQNPQMLGQLAAWQRAGGNNYLSAAQAAAQGGTVGYQTPWQDTEWGNALMDIFRQQRGY